jgi:crotonobetainyl-CoA:carnitine CoA-transferase CaiB-like acyl-CoA transferase
MAKQALSGVKVLDLTHHIVGPYCTKLLADYGADVIKVEQPGVGDIARRMGPFFKDDPHPEKSGLFLHLNTNKKSITLHLKNETGKKILKELVKAADILVENFEPGLMPSLDLGFDELAKVNPKLVMTSISNFGQSGPYRDFKASELILYGMGGAMYMCGLPEREPQKLAGTFLLYQAGIAAANACMAALFVSELQGEGQHVDVAISEAVASGVDRLHTNLIAYAFNQEIQDRFTIVSAYPPGSGPYPCQDGYVDLVLMAMRYIDRTRDLLGHPEFLEDPKWEDPLLATKQELRDEFIAFYLGWLIDKTKREVTDLADKNGILGAPLNTAEDLFTDPHLKERETFVEIDHPVTGPLKYASRPFRMSETPWQLRRPAPLLGEHNEEVYGELGYSGEELARLRQEGVI